MATIKYCAGLLLLQQFLHFTYGLQFYLEQGQTICFSENIAPNAKVLGEYTVAAGNGHMPVNIVVRDTPENTTLLERNNIAHGKFAFVMPFGKQAPKVHTAELHRREGGSHHDHYDHHHDEHHDEHHDDYHSAHHDSPPEHEHGHDWDHKHDNNLHTTARFSRGHEDEHHYSDSHDHHSDGHEHHSDGHEHYSDGHEHYSDGHEHDYRHHDSSDSYHREREHNYHEHHHEGGGETKLDHMDAHDGEHEDVSANWDMDKYEGIHDEDLDKDWEHNEQHAHHDEEEETDEDNDIFKDRRVEICITSESADRSALRRRVRLLVRHGKMAHDYTSLAKKENLSSLELTLRIVSDELKWLLSELDHARQMEDALRKLNEGTSRRVVHYASLSMLVLLGVSAFQAMYTKRFFKTKKLL